MTIIKPIHITKYLPPPFGGVEAHVDTLLRSLAPEVQATLLTGQSLYKGIGNFEPLPYRILVARSFGNLSSVTLSPGILKIFKDDLRSGASNLLHIHAPNPWGDIAALFAPKKLPIVMTWHSDIIRQKKLMVAYSPIQRRAIDRVDRIIVCTPKHYNSSKQLNRINIQDKVRFIPFGINFEHLCESNINNYYVDYINKFLRGRPFLLTIGRHVYYKGYEYLLRAMARIKTETVLIMVGAGYLTNQLKILAKELGIESRILFLGEVNDEFLVNLLHSCDLFCLPSIEQSEAFGIASAEAMACGKSVIVCELNNGVNYLNIHEKTGLTVPPKDINALAEAIDMLILNDSLRKKMGDFAHSWVRQEFSIKEMKSRTIELYNEIM